MRISSETGAYFDYNIRMNDLHSRIERLLPLVQNPAQYVGGEWNIVRKPGSPGRIRVAFVFPDTYAIGMSHLGLQVLYHVLNSLDGCACERAFLPWDDMESLMRRNGIPLWTLESFTPLAEFDVVAFSLQYELTYTNVLNALDLAGIPLRSADRGENHPLVVAGGPGALNPEPLADFIDLFVVGDGEETAPALVRAIAKAKSEKKSRRDALLDIARSNESFYVPAFVDVSYHPDVADVAQPPSAGASSDLTQARAPVPHKQHGTVASIKPNAPGIPFPVRAAVVSDLDAAAFPTKPVVPNTEVIHDRIALEIMRGCCHHCRFCQAGATRRPLRLRSVEKLCELADACYASTGCDEMSLTSLSSNDYPHMERLLAKLDARFRPLGVSLSVPSLRVGPSLMLLPELLSRVRKSGLTFAPEAATKDLADIIGKHIDLVDLRNGVREAFASGWDLVKLYFMVGLPGETDGDIAGIAALSKDISNLRREVGKGPANVNVTIAPFIPKPHTPLQWEPMAPVARLEQVRAALRDRLRDRRVQMKFHNINRSFLEGVFSRGDRRLGKVLEAAWKLGAKFDAWDEHFKPAVWDEAFKASGIDPAFYTSRPRAADEVLPWSFIDPGLPEGYLLSEKKNVDDLISARTSK